MNDAQVSSNSSVPSPDPAPAAAATASPPPSWAGLVERVQEAHPSGLQELYEIFSKGIRFYLWRHLGPQDLDDRVHDAFLVVTQSIQNGELRDPERLMGFVRTIVRRQVASHSDELTHARVSRFSQEALASVHDRHIGPEEAAIQRQQGELAMRVLRSIPGRDREVLVRFYLREQTPAEICGELKLTETQFRLIKSRAKARFGELGRARLAQRAGFLTKVK